MQRTIARLLLLFALAGNLIPLALAATVSPLHACCLRKAHHCHNLPSSDTSPAVSSTDCCSHGCCGVITTSRWAYPQLHIRSVRGTLVASFLIESAVVTPSSQLPNLQSSRAPPALA
jgi:hypothetical protein